MRILYIVNKMTHLAGIERILSCKMNYLAENTEHQIMLTTYEQQDEPLSFPLSDKIEYFPFDVPMAERTGNTFIGWIEDNINSRYLFRKEFKKILFKTRPDIVITTGYTYPVLDIFIKTSHYMGIRTIIESHIQSETVSMSRYIYNPIVKRLFSFWDWYILKSLKRCNCVVTLTHYDATYWKKYTTRTEVIPNMLTIKPKYVDDYSVKRIICAGRYAPQKGYDLLLETWRQLASDYRDWHLFIFGNGDRTPYQRIVDRLGLGNCVHLMDATPNIAEEFSHSSLYVMSSRFEGFPLVLGEAMSCGLPCVSFDCPHGPRDIIRDGEDGLLVENGNIQKLAHALQQLMDSEEKRKEMGLNAKKNILRYSPESIMSLWITLFRNL